MGGFGSVKHPETALFEISGLGLGEIKQKSATLTHVTLRATCQK